jgi:hypothetical protein
VSDQNRNDCVIIDASFHKAGETMRFLYGKSGTVNVQPAPDGFSLYVRLDLGPRQFVILQ